MYIRVKALNYCIKKKVIQNDFLIWFMKHYIKNYIKKPHEKSKM
jgi:hypothetical protein